MPQVGQVFKSRSLCIWKVLSLFTLEGEGKVTFGFRYVTTSWLKVKKIKAKRVQNHTAIEKQEFVYMLRSHHSITVLETQSLISSVQRRCHNCLLLSLLHPPPPCSLPNQPVLTQPTAVTTLMQTEYSEEWVSWCEPNLLYVRLRVKLAGQEGGRNVNGIWQLLLCNFQIP